MPLHLPPRNVTLHSCNIEPSHIPARAGARQVVVTSLDDASVVALCTVAHCLALQKGCSFPVWDTQYTHKKNTCQAYKKHLQFSALSSRTKQSAGQVFFVSLSYGHVLMTRALRGYLHKVTNVDDVATRVDAVARFLQLLKAQCSTNAKGYRLCDDHRHPLINAGGYKFSSINFLLAHHHRTGEGNGDGVVAGLVDLTDGESLLNASTEEHADTSQKNNELLHQILRGTG